MNQRNEAQLRKTIVKLGRELYQRGLVVATDGNLSARLNDGRFLATPSGLCKGWLREDELIVVDPTGKRVDRPNASNRHLKPTSELQMHLEAYRRRPDAEAIIHAHPPHAIALSITGDGFDNCFLPEALLFVGIPFVTPYATPSSAEGAVAIREAVTGHDVIVLQRHGSLALGTSLEEAYFRTESLEQLARIRHLAICALGSGSESKVSDLSPQQAAKLLALRKWLGLSRAADAADFCEHCGVCGALVSSEPEDTTKHVPRDSSLLAVADASAGLDLDEARVRELVARVLDSFDS